MTLYRLALALLLALGAYGVARAEDTASYVGAQACAACHKAETMAWSGSHHALAMQPATPATVLGDFSGVTLQQDGVKTTFFRDGDRFMVRTDGPDNAPHDYQVAYTFGVQPLQQYLIAFPGGRYQALGAAWDSRPKAQGGQRWYALYPGQALRAPDRLHWTGRDQTWNYQCAACHSTDLRKGYDLATDSYATTFSDVNVACEACHGPASRHLAWAKAPDADPRKGLTTALSDANRGRWEMTASGIARRTDAPSSAELEACGGCHARRSVIAPNPTPATPFADAYRAALLDPGLYHADGQIDGEVFEYGSFVQSRMQRAGVTCTNCHDPHTARLRLEGNALCGQCHAAEKFDTAAHTHHAPDGPGAQCVACHMPAKTYMGVDQRRDHSFRVPRPDLSARIGVPNTCTQCHADKPAEWAAQAVAGWSPGGRQTTGHYGIALHAARTGAADAEALLDGLIGDADSPAIARATALRSLPPFLTPASEAAILAAARDPEPLVREAVPATMANGALSQSVMAAVANLLSDPVRAVRIQAASALAGVNPRALSPAQREALQAATKELVEAELTDADRAESHMNLGNLAMHRGDAAEAKAQYETALRLDPAFVPALVNLADLARMNGADQDGAAFLRRAIAIDPRSADAHYALGLYLVRQHDPGAMAELRQASVLAPENARYAYVYAVALNSTGAVSPAMALLDHAHQQHPADRDILTALISISQQNGDVQRALRYAQELAKLEPGNRDLQRLIDQMSAPRRP